MAGSFHYLSSLTASNFTYSFNIFGYVFFKAIENHSNILEEEKGVASNRHAQCGEK